MKKLVKSKQLNKVLLMSLLALITLTILGRLMDRSRKKGHQYLERNKVWDNRKRLRLIRWNCQRTLSITTSKNASVSCSVLNKRHRIKAKKMFFVTHNSSLKKVFSTLRELKQQIQHQLLITRSKSSRQGWLRVRELTFCTIQCTKKCRFTPIKTYLCGKMWSLNNKLIWTKNAMISYTSK